MMLCMQWLPLSVKIPETPQDLLEIVMENRGLHTKKEQDEFLHPLSPLTLTLEQVGIDKNEMKKALELLKQAKKEQWTVVVFGDYDCDGICGTAVLWEVLYKNGIQAMPFLPNRERHGYGLSLKALEEIFAEGKKAPQLVITVDNGVVAHEPFAWLKSRGVKTILTDHHQPDAQGYPQADAVIHTTQLCGTTVGWMFARELDAEFAADTMDLCAIATIADQVELLKANRSFAYYGLQQLRTTKRVGLRALIEAAQINPDEIDARTVNYAIAPRLNAMGRIGDPMDGLRLLCTKNPERAYAAAEGVHTLNADRQQMTIDMVQHAKNQQDRWKDEHIIIVASATYHEGVIGLIAGKLMEDFAKPAIAIAIGEKTAKGSARSPRGIHITELLRKLQHELLDVGGHPMAAGFSVAASNVSNFTEQLYALAKKEIQVSSLVMSQEYDCELPESLVTLETEKLLQQCAPFGMRNPQPLFYSARAIVESLNSMGKSNEHSKLLLRLGNHSVQAVWFRKTPTEIMEMSHGNEISLLYYLSVNAWRGKETLQLLPKDAKAAASQQ